MFKAKRLPDKSMEPSRFVYGGWVLGHPHTGDHILLHLFTQIHGMVSFIYVICECVILKKIVVFFFQSSDFLIHNLLIIMFFLYMVNIYVNNTVVMSAVANVNHYIY